MKVDLRHPEIIIQDKSGVALHVFSKFNNDYNVPMIRINQGNLLYDVSQSEFAAVEQFKQPASAE